VNIMLGHRRDSLRATHFENTVRARQMADRNHRRVSARWQTGNNVVTARQ
jgi:hypothetical protein